MSSFELYLLFLSANSFEVGFDFAMSHELITTLTVFKRITKSSQEGAEYSRDENGVVITRAPGASGVFAQGDSFEEARENLRGFLLGSFIFDLSNNQAFCEG